MWAWTAWSARRVRGRRMNDMFGDGWSRNVRRSRYRFARANLWIQNCLSDLQLGLSHSSLGSSRERRNCNSLSVCSSCTSCNLVSMMRSFPEIARRLTLHVVLFNGRTYFRRELLLYLMGYPNVLKYLSKSHCRTSSKRIGPLGLPLNLSQPLAHYDVFFLRSVCSGSCLSRSSILSRVSERKLACCSLSAPCLLKAKVSLT